MHGKRIVSSSFFLFSLSLFLSARDNVTSVKVQAKTQCKILSRLINIRAATHKSSRGKKEKKRKEAVRVPRWPISIGNFTSGPARSSAGPVCSAFRETTFERWTFPAHSARLRSTSTDRRPSNGAPDECSPIARNRELIEPIHGFQGDSGAYRSRVGGGVAAGTFGRATSTGSGLPSCRTSYSSIGSGSSRVPTKERISGFGNAFLKKDKADEKPSFKYTGELKNSPH